ncbi:MAG TPA: sulfite exporter TauE/SafE family protein [Capillibacterium sp.]
MTTAQMLFTLLIVFFASLLQATVGFGFSLLSVPLLVTILPVTMVTPLIVLCCLLNNVIVLLDYKAYLRFSEVWLLIFFGITGIPLGVYALKHLDQNILKLVIGAVIIITGLAMLGGFQIKFRHKIVGSSIAGFMSGVLNGGFGMSSPPIVLFLTNEGYPKNRFKADLVLYGIITNLVTILSFSLENLINLGIIKMAGFCGTMVFLGSFLGLRIAKEITESVFRRLTLWFLVGMGLITVLNGLQFRVR